MSTQPNMQDTAPAPNDLNPGVLVNLGVATIDGTIPAANLPVGTDSDQVAAGDDNRFPIPLSAAPSRGLEVWIAPDRTDNPTAAKGTYEDPLDGSTRAKFEAALNSLHTNLTIHLLPGTFHTLGAQGAGPMKEGWRVIGAGMDKTTILLDPVPNASNLEQDILGATEQLNAFTLTDLTLDGNIANQPNGLLVHGGGISCVVGTYERVHLLNWGQTPLTINDEAFGISPGADPGLPKIVPPYFRIIDCVVDAPAGNAASMINLGYAGGTVPTDFASGEIRGNIVTGSYTSAGIALAGCFNGVIISGNHVRHCGRGFHQDTLMPNPPAGAVLVSQNVVIEHNLFEDCQTPIGMSAGSGQHINYRSHHNSLGLSGLHVAEYGAPTGSAFFFGGGIQNFRSDHDRVYRSLPGASGTVYYCSNEYGNNLVSFDNLSVQDGIWAPDNMDGIQNRLGASANNRYDSGDSLSLLGESNARVVFSTTQRNAGLNAGRLRLIYSQAINNEYIYQSSKYLIRLTTGGGNTSYKESLFLFSLSKPYEGNMSVQVNVLEGTPDAKLVMVSTLGGAQVGDVPAQVKFVLSTPQVAAEYGQIVVTDLGNFSPPLGYTEGVWSTEVVDSGETTILNGKAPATNYPLLSAPTDAAGNVVLPNLAGPVQISTLGGGGSGTVSPGLSIFQPYEYPGTGDAQGAGLSLVTTNGASTWNLGGIYGLVGDPNQLAGYPGGLGLYYKAGDGTLPGSLTEGARLDYQGNFGIGTKSPAYKLDVAGATRATTYYGDGSHLSGVSVDGTAIAPASVLYPDLSTLPSTVVNGSLIRVGSHAYMGLGGAWKQLDN